MELGEQDLFNVYIRKISEKTRLAREHHGSVQPLAFGSVQIKDDFSKVFCFVWSWESKGNGWSPPEKRPYCGFINRWFPLIRPATKLLFLRGVC